MRKPFDYLLSGIYLLYFGLLLVVFHVIQFIAFHVFGRVGHKKSVDVFNFFIAYGMYIMGTSISCHRKYIPPIDRPIIFICNHQSMYDIPGIVWFLRRNHPIFVSKIELAKGIPGISYNLRKSGAALINRKDGKQAITEIARLAKLIQSEKSSAVIFPEGTRSTTGIMRPFAPGGIAILLKKAPDALVVPVAIKGTGKLNPKGAYPLRAFTNISWTVLDPIEPAGKTAEEVAALSRQIIEKEISI